jgi:cytochrome c-type biogenesis protein CcmE
MKTRKLKFGIGIAIILGVVAWEAVTGFQQSKTYYVTVSELLHGKSQRQRVRVGGTVAPDSIKRHNGSVTFRLAQNSDFLPVTYLGSETLPDTFKDGAQAVIEGDFGTDGTFRAEHIQAKCASKYQALPGPSTTSQHTGQAGQTAKNLANANPADPASSARK